jgi:large subunit ribosomal protein L1
MSLDTNTVLEAIKQLRAQPKKRKFSQSMELIINLQDIDMKKPEGRIQENIELPHAPTKKAKVCVIATGELALKAKKTGADLLSNTDLESLATDKKRQKQLANTFDTFLAEAPLMPLVGKTLGAILGPRGKMPKPLLPNADIEAQIAKSAKTISLRVRGQPVLQCAVGTEDMNDDELAENTMAVVKRLEGKLKRGLKNMRTIYLKTTMSPPVKIKI